MRLEAAPLAAMPKVRLSRLPTILTAMSVSQGSFLGSISWLWQCDL